MDYKLISELFFQRTPLNLLIPFTKFLLQSSIRTLRNVENDEKLTESFFYMQNKLVSYTICSIGNFSPALSYKRQFIRALYRSLNELVDSNKPLQLSSSIYQVYGEIIQLRNEPTINQLIESYISINDEDRISMRNLIDNNNVGFSTHFLDIHKFAILESNDLVSEGTTGLRTWPAAVYLLNSLFKVISKFDRLWNRPNGWSNIIELGSGTGLLGIGLIKTGFTNRYTFTDNSNAALDRIHFNCFVNEIPLRKDGTEIHHLDWSNIYSGSSLLSVNYDLILATDVIYDPVVIGYFVKALTTLFRAYRQLDPSGRYPDCFVCNGIRNQYTRDYFFEKMLVSHFRVEIICYSEQPDWSLKLLRAAEAAQFYGSGFDYTEISLLNSDIIPLEIYHITPNEQTFNPVDDASTT